MKVHSCILYVTSSWPRRPRVPALRALHVGHLAGTANLWWHSDADDTGERRTREEPCFAGLSGSLRPTTIKKLRRARCKILNVHGYVAPRKDGAHCFIFEYDLVWV
jgi:hypothetical protein